MSEAEAARRLGLTKAVMWALDLANSKGSVLAGIRGWAACVRVPAGWEK